MKLIHDTGCDSRIRRILVFVDHGADDKTDQHSKRNAYSGIIPYRPAECSAETHTKTHAFCSIIAILFFTFLFLHCTPDKKIANSSPIATQGEAARKKSKIESIFASSLFSVCFVHSPCKTSVSPEGGFCRVALTNLITEDRSVPDFASSSP